VDVIIYHYQSKGERKVAKSRDTKKETKKKPTQTLKEKRQTKKSKK
jgi:hypothetical protein